MHKPLLVFLFALPLRASSQETEPARNAHCITDQAPLVATPYAALPLGAIKTPGLPAR